MHCLSNKEQEKWMEDYVERETAVETKGVKVAETVIRQEQKDMKSAENTGLSITQPEKLIEEMMIAIGESLCDLASSDNEENWEDEDDEDTELGKLSEDNEPGWVVATISKMGQQRMERYW